MSGRSDPIAELLKIKPSREVLAQLPRWMQTIYEFIEDAEARQKPLHQ